MELFICLSIINRDDNGDNFERLIRNLLDKKKKLNVHFELDPIMDLLQNNFLNKIIRIDIKWDDIFLEKSFVI